MRNKPYYSVRTGKNKLRGFDLPEISEEFRQIFCGFDADGYFREYFGHMEWEYVPGILGHDLSDALLFELRKKISDPLRNAVNSEEDLFDIIEFLHEHCSKPVGDKYHEKYHKQKGQEEYREKINKLLKVYKDGYELSVDGEILVLPDSGLERLIKADLPKFDPENIEKRVQDAIRKFTLSKSSLADRGDAIRDLAGVFEYLKENGDLQKALTRKDEKILFEIANNFCIRHHNTKQKSNYDKNIWHSWIFYVYLATYHATVRLIKKGASQNLENKQG